MFLWIKALHVIAIISWMAGLLYLPRLFVYHAGVAAGSEASAMLMVMERKLLNYIMRPASIVVLLTGGALISTPGLVDWSMHWMPVKLIAVILLFGVHGALESYAAKFARGANTKPARFFRIINEVPTILMIIIVAMVIAKPF